MHLAILIEQFFKQIGLNTSMRLQRVIVKLIDDNQIGFLQGRSIVESFVHAAELI